MKRFMYVALVASALTPSLAFAAPTITDNATTYQNQNLTGNDITGIQQSLINQGYLQGTATGTWDANTSSALRSYQLKNHLGSNGSLDASTVDHLGVHIGSSAPVDTGTGAAAYDNNGSSKMSVTGPNSTNPSSPMNDYGTTATINSSNSMSSGSKK